MDWYTEIEKKWLRSVPSMHGEVIALRFSKKKDKAYLNNNAAEMSPAKPHFFEVLATIQTKFYLESQQKSILRKKIITDSRD